MGTGESDLDRRLRARIRAGELGSGWPPAPDSALPLPLRRPIVAAFLGLTPEERLSQPASPFHGPLIDLCYERGFAAVTIAELCRRAGLDRGAFEQRYADLQDCFFQVCRAELGRYRRRAAVARAGFGEWRDRLRATAYALYRYLDEDERLRKFTAVEFRLAGERPALLIAAEIERLFDLIDEGRAEPGAPPSLTRATAESLGAGIFNEIFFTAAHAAPMPREEQLVPEIMYSAVLPYLGSSSAAEELHIPPPPRTAV